MKEIKDMDREELLEVIRIKDARIAELKGELDIYRELVDQLREKLSEPENRV